MSVQFSKPLLCCLSLPSKSAPWGVGWDLGGSSCGNSWSNADSRTGILEDTPYPRSVWLIPYWENENAEVKKIKELIFQNICICVFSGPCFLRLKQGACGLAQAVVAESCCWCTRRGLRSLFDRLMGEGQPGGSVSLGLCMSATQQCVVLCPRHHSTWGPAMHLPSGRLL